MHKLHIILSILILTSVLTGCVGNTEVQAPTSISVQTEPVTSEVVSQGPATNCPVTALQVPAFVPPAPYDGLNSFKDHFWFGSSFLWTNIPINGTWNALPHNPEGYTQKVLWWRDGYLWDQEPEPNLIVTGERLDESAPPLNVSHANGAYASDIGSAMMVGVDFPTLGCWKITGKYQDAELSFVIWVAP
ncbi:MAG: hypothetical protein ABI904_19365 [Chloroflexota bacterium]